MQGVPASNAPHTGTTTQDQAREDSEGNGAEVRVYLAGPMRGYPKSNFPAFFDAAERLREQGHEVFCPAEWDVREHGFTRDGQAPEGWSLREGLADDLWYLCYEAELVALLPGWERSRGAAAEVAAAQALDIPVKTLEYVLRGARHARV